MTQIASTLLTLAKHPLVATAAGFTTAEWQSHVDWYVKPWIANVNVGRLPMLLLSEDRVDYIHEMEPNHGGTRTTRIEGLIPVRAFRKDNITATNLARNIFLAFIRLVRSNTSAIHLGNETLETIQPTNYGFMLPFSLDINTTFNKDYQES